MDPSALRDSVYNPSTDFNQFASSTLVNIAPQSFTSMPQIQQTVSSTPPASVLARMNMASGLDASSQQLEQQQQAISMPQSISFTHQAPSPMSNATEPIQFATPTVIPVTYAYSQPMVASQVPMPDLQTASLQPNASINTVSPASSARLHAFPPPPLIIASPPLQVGNSVPASPFAPLLCTPQQPNVPLSAQIAPSIPSQLMFTGTNIAVPAVFSTRHGRAASLSSKAEEVGIAQQPWPTQQVTAQPPVESAIVRSMPPMEQQNAIQSHSHLLQANIAAISGARPFATSISSDVYGIPATDFRKTVLVVNATSAQGRAVCESLLTDPQFKVRALVRDSRSDAAVRLAESGVEVFQGDLLRPDTLRPALRGCWGVHIHTSFMQEWGEQAEYEQGRNIVDLAIALGVKFIVLSALPGASRLTKSAIRVPHFDGKWSAAEYLRDSGIDHTILFVPFYYENWGTLTAPTRDSQQRLIFSVPLGGRKFALASVRDVGAIAAEVFRRGPSELSRKTIEVYGDLLDLATLVKTYARVTGENAVAHEADTKQLRALSNDPANEFARMFEFLQWLDEHRDSGGDISNPYSALIPSSSLISGGRQLLPSMLTWEQYLQRQSRLSGGNLRASR